MFSMLTRSLRTNRKISYAYSDKKTSKATKGLDGLIYGQLKVYKLCLRKKIDEHHMSLFGCVCIEGELNSFLIKVD
jgi:hypothetical protein